MNYKEQRVETILKLFPVPVKKGSGLLNSVIDKLPFELHLPGGYQYAGPGTHLDLKLERGVKPKNKLDEAAMYHDIAYSKSNNLADRHTADRKLQHDAWKRVLAKDASLGEKANAWLVTNAMKAKRAIGAGIGNKKKKNKPKYIKYAVNLDSEQAHRVATSTKPVRLKIKHGRTKNSVINETFLPLTETQIKNIRENKSIRLSSAQLKHIKSGGFLPALLAAVPAVASILGTIYNSYSNKKTNDQLIEEKIRHNKAMEGKGLYLMKKPKALTEGGSINKGNGLLQELLKKKRHSVK